MSHGKLRKEKSCLNCGHTVEEIYCPNCGQQNTEPRQPFHYLFGHFVEDFTHYDGLIWRTMKNLLFRPGQLSKIYTEGKRQRYVPPVKLYIFISFITFLLPGLLPSVEKFHPADRSAISSRAQAQAGRDQAAAQIKNLEHSGIISKDNAEKASEELAKSRQGAEIVSDSPGDRLFVNIGTLREYDELVRSKNSFFGKLFRPFIVKFFELKDGGLTQQQIREKFIEAFIHTLPKALFIYLPIFAFILWLFHDKRRWWYFDHGIFTLHYFSFLLAAVLAVTLLGFLKDLADFPAVHVITGLLVACITIYSGIYFFMAHHRFYQTSKTTTVLKGFLIFAINCFCMLTLLIGLLGLSFLMIH